MLITPTASQGYTNTYYGDDRFTEEYAFHLKQLDLLVANAEKERDVDIMLKEHDMINAIPVKIRKLTKKDIKRMSKENEELKCLLKEKEAIIQNLEKENERLHREIDTAPRYYLGNDTWI